MALVQCQTVTRWDKGGWISKQIEQKEQERKMTIRTKRKAKKQEYQENSNINFGNLVYR
jgi:hypothetical protein